MKLSIVIPSYNAYETTLKLVKSLQKQDLKEVEVIVVNDGSTEKYGAFPTWVKFINNTTNKGAVFARQTGWKKATGEYIWFFDCDDLINDNAIANIKKHLKQADLHVFPMIKQKPNGKKYLFPLRVKNIASIGYATFFQNKIFKRSLIKCNMFDLKSRIFQDENFIIRYGAKVKSVAVFKKMEPISTYLYHYGSVSKSKITKTKVMNLVNNINLLLPFVAQLPHNDYRQYVQKQMTRMLTIARGKALVLKRAQHKAIIKKIKKLQKKAPADTFGYVFNFSLAAKLIWFVEKLQFIF